MSDRLLISSPEGVDLEFHLAGLFSRFMALVVDFLLMGCLWLTLALLLFSGWSEDEDTVRSALLLLVMFLTYWGYAVAFELGMRGQTPGKRLMGLRVLREDGLPVGLRESALRNLLRAIDMQPGFLYVVGAVALMVDPRGRRLGDLVAGTLVVRESLSDARGTRAGAAWAARAERGQAHQAVRLAGGTLSARQIALIEQFLERSPQLDPARRRILAEGLARPLEGLLDDEMVRLMRSDPQQLLERIRTLARTQEETTGVVPETAPKGGLW